MRTEIPISPCRQCGEDMLAWVSESDFIGCCNCAAVFEIEEKMRDSIFAIFFQHDRISKGGEMPKVLRGGRK